MALTLRKPPKSVIMNDDGKTPIVLNEFERMNAERWEKRINEEFKPLLLSNALGSEVSITTLTAITKKVSEQKFYQIPFAQYVPVIVGQGTWGSNLTTFRSFDVADPFETGIINTGGDNSRQASVDTAVDTVNIAIINWAKQYGWSIFDLQLASMSGNWSLIAGKEKSRKRNWDLGLQRLAFLGATGLNAAGGACLGLLNQPGVTFNTTLVTSETGQLQNMTYTQINAFVQALMQDYQANCNYTAYPNRLVLPTSDWNGLASQVSPEFPVKMKIEMLEEVCKRISQRADFKILPAIYCDLANAGSASQPSQVTTSQYALYNYDEESIVMNIPLDYTSTMQNTLEGFNFQCAALGQFTGVNLIRPAEMLYFGW